VLRSLLIRGIANDGRDIPAARRSARAEGAVVESVEEDEKAIAGKRQGTETSDARTATAAMIR
jgi:hypothetical protein